MKSKLVWWIGVLLVLGLVGCTGSGTSALVGKWVHEVIPDVEIVFFKDGSGTLSEGKDVTKFTWTVAENGQLTFRWSGNDIESVDYKIASVLTFGGEKLIKKDK